MAKAVNWFPTWQIISLCESGPFKRTVQGGVPTRSRLIEASLGASAVARGKRPNSQEIMLRTIDPLLGEGGALLRRYPSQRAWFTRLM
jgi:hypothetical protein